MTTPGWGSCYPGSEKRQQGRLCLQEELSELGPEPYAAQLQTFPFERRIPGDFIDKAAEGYEELRHDCWSEWRGSRSRGEAQPCSGGSRRSSFCIPSS